MRSFSLEYVFYVDTWHEGEHEQKKWKKEARKGLESTFSIMKYTERQRIFHVEFLKIRAYVSEEAKKKKKTLHSKI